MKDESIRYIIRYVYVMYSARFVLSFALMYSEIFRSCGRKDVGLRTTYNWLKVMANFDAFSLPTD